MQGFPGGSAEKNPRASIRDAGLIPGSGRFPREGNCNPLVFLVAQLVKNLPAMWETWVQSLGWEDSLEKGKFTHSSILPWRIP